MNNPAKSTFDHCTVAGDDSLPSMAGGGEALCRAVEAAIKAQTSTRDYQVELSVTSRSRISAQLVVNGRRLPEQRFAVMDGEIGPNSIQHFADSLAAVISKAEK